MNIYLKTTKRTARTALNSALALAATVIIASPGTAAPVKEPTAKEPTAAVPDAAEQRRFLEASRREHNVPHDWQPEVSFAFDDAAELKRLKVINGQWTISEGQLKATGGELDDNRTILIAPVLEGPQRIEFDATLLARPDGRIGDICIRLNADPTTGSFARGYALIAAQYFNQSAVCYRLNMPFSRTEWAPVIPGKRHRIVLEWTPSHGHLRFFVDDKILLDTWDRTAPLPPDPTKWIGLSTYGTEMIVDNLVISSGTRATKPRN